MAKFFSFFLWHLIKNQLLKKPNCKKKKLSINNIQSIHMRGIGLVSLNICEPPTCRLVFKLTNADGVKVKKTQTRKRKKKRPVCEKKSVVSQLMTASRPSGVFLTFSFSRLGVGVCQRLRVFWEGRRGSERQKFPAASLSSYFPRGWRERDGWYEKEKKEKNQRWEGIKNPQQMAVNW